MTIKPSTLAYPIVVFRLVHLFLVDKKERYVVNGELHSLFSHEKNLQPGERHELLRHLKKTTAVCCYSSRSSSSGLSIPLLLAASSG